MFYQDTMAWAQLQETTDRSKDKVRRLEVNLGKLQDKHKSDHKCQTFSRLSHSPDQPCPGLKCSSATPARMRYTSSVPHLPRPQQCLQVRS